MKAHKQADIEASIAQVIQTQQATDWMSKTQQLHTCKPRAFCHSRATGTHPSAIKALHLHLQANSEHRKAGTWQKRLAGTPVNYLLLVVSTDMQLDG